MAAKAIGLNSSFIDASSSGYSASVTAIGDVGFVPTPSPTKSYPEIFKGWMNYLLARDDDQPDKSTDACELGGCGDSCLGDNGGGSWVTVGPVDCDNIPIETSTSTAKPNADIKKRDDDPPPSPLPDLPEYGIPLMRYLGNMQEKLHNENKYLDIWQGETTGKWFPFGTEKVVAGMSGVFGCTGVYVISNKGAYTAHIFEVPVFKPSAEATELASDSYYQKWTFDSIIHGNKDSGLLEPLEELYGTDDNPGPLHYTHQPEIYIITPFKVGTRGPFKYGDKVQWLSDKLHDYFYPPNAADFAQDVKMVGYKPVKKNIANEVRNLDGKILLEYNPLDKYERNGNQVTPMARWRMFSSGTQAATKWFANPSATAARRGLGRRIEGSGAICPAPDLSSSATSAPSSTSSSLITSSTWSLPSATLLSPPSSTPATDPLPSNPSEIEGPNCADSDDGNDLEVDRSVVQKLADVCTHYMLPADTMTMGPAIENITWSIGKGWDEWYYTAAVRFEGGCNGPAQNLAAPMEGYDCNSLLKGNFDDCKTGGSTKVGCLVYESLAEKDDNYSG